MRLLASAMLAVLLLTSARPSDAVAAPVASARPDRYRGALVSLEMISTMKLGDAQRIAAEFPGGISVRSGAQLFRITYWTVLQGRPTLASGLVAVPLSAGSPKRVMMFLHGTNATRALSPSQPDRVDGNEEAAVFAGNGYIVVLPDYIGLGVSQVPHPYLISQPQVDATLDLLRAFRQSDMGRGAANPADLFMMGFSQGGQVVAAVHRALERRPLSGYRLRASIGIAGPYDLRETSLPKAIENNCRLCVGYLTWATYAYSVYYHHPLGAALQPRYASAVPGLFNGSYAAEEIGAALPDDPAAMFRPAFLKAMQARTANWFTQALAQNETYRWAPIAPFRLYFGNRDVDVPPAASQAFYDYARAHGGNVTLHPLVGADHQASSALTYAPALAWFNSLSRSR